MLEVLDIVGESYSAVMAIVNFGCFAALCVCITYLFVAWTIGLLDGVYKRYGVACLIAIVALCVVHYITSTYFGIPLLVPPIQTEYFVQFIHVIQYIVTFAFVGLCLAIFLLAVASRFDRYYGHLLMSAFIAFFVLIFIHYWVFDEFGVSLIFPPTMW